jgi:hypothetical protein
MKTKHKEVKNHPAKNENEIEQPERHEMERGSLPDKEFANSKPNEVEQVEQNETNVRDTTLSDLDATFIGIDHHRKTGRMLDHEPSLENNL